MCVNVKVTSSQARPGSLAREGFQDKQTFCAVGPGSRHATGRWQTSEGSGLGTGPSSHPGKKLRDGLFHPWTCVGIIPVHPVLWVML